MSCKSALYMANTALQTVSVGSVINFGSIIRRFGQNLNGSGSSVELMGVGYYDIDANFNLVGTSVGNVIITLYKDGSPIVGATQTVSVAVGDSYAVSIPCLVREKCCCGSTITAMVTGESVNISNATITVEKV